MFIVYSIVDKILAVRETMQYVFLQCAYYLRSNMS